MPFPPSDLTCEFTLAPESPDLSLRAQIDGSGLTSYGGWLLLDSPLAHGPITTGLWDSDGNVFFTLFLGEDPSGASVVINSGSKPGTYTPYVVVQSQNGLSCEIVATGSNPSTNTFSYKLEVGLASETKP